MKKSLLLWLSLALAVGLTACKSTDKDNIELSAHAVIFESGHGAVNITTGFSGWWFERIEANNRFYFPDYRTNQKQKEMIWFEAGWVAVERTSDNGLWVDVQENTTGYPRYATITVTSGSYVDYVSVIQYAR